MKNCGFYITQFFDNLKQFKDFLKLFYKINILKLFYKIYKMNNDIYIFYVKKD